jgi:hypothetical protein
MIIILILVAISALIIFAVSKSSPGDEVFAAIICGVISSIVIIFVVGTSYITYLDTRAQYDAVITQYKGAVTMYADYASLDMEKATFTDFKYQGYQENIAKVIVDLRKEIISYNKTIIKKRIMNKNPVFSWLIIVPDKDMKIINIVE